MRKHRGLLLILLIAASSLLVGCSAASSFAGPEENVTFIVRIDVEPFSPEANLHVRIWDSGQLKIAESNANCTVSYNLETQTEEVHCPGGVEYQEASPEEFEFLVQDLGAEIKIRSTSVTVGERYRLQISGLANDDCNTALASVEDEADSTQIVLENLMYGTTMMACP